ncbi:MAG: hypothetical protein A2204_07615 [Elusimicrobia bacterium RIFOXYA1_FULL_47_7]|nr:MAG: hypothetical protein A2278_01965 [Elusimicrobia bacterium RIFOXYA12_FULL_49_49]OGS06024.1 MAG: hypothetical protein A2204_07615 [Elusimicrobia bacterium RIFOXYA1_FULL_47_7]OGS16812.1 MAG: hypothetical protein A2251_05415 [Elusimicrobia bacterium RIFOXYA2_FULL_47_53]OGS32040.1 MAG: hypothetical protein A2323_08190 [Elusimicrobia bacterium RIFOXYB2_FULL_46_23]
MKKLFFEVLCLFIAFISVVSAEVPTEITYQGRLHEYNQPVTANRVMSFKIYDAASGGNQLWSSGDINISVQNGVFSYVLTPNLDWRTKNLWIETVVSSKILSPREKITAQGFALHSKTSEDIEKSAGTIHFAIGSSTYASVSANGLSVGGNATIKETNNTVEISTKVVATEFESSYGFYHDRGDPSAYDYTDANLTKDGNWHDLDLSGIVPVGTKAVSIFILAAPMTSGYALYWRKNGNSNIFNKAGMYFGAQAIMGDLTVPCDANRVVEYMTPHDISGISICIKGWWK